MMPLIHSGMFEAEMIGRPPTSMRVPSVGQQHAADIEKKSDWFFVPHHGQLTLCEDAMLEIADLLTMLDEAFEKKAWHGPNLRGTLRGVDARQAGWRPAGGRHNIWELAVHAAYWKYAVRRRLTGAKRASFPVVGSNWFERPQDGSDAEWKADLRLLVQQHRELRATVAALRAAELRGATGEAKLHLIRGVAAHDLYHAGQIQLLKSAQRGTRSLEGKKTLASRCVVRDVN
jgi:hypothetical protein